MKGDEVVELKEESAYLYLLRYLWNNNFSVQNIFVIKSLYRAALDRKSVV